MSESESETTDRLHGAFEIDTPEGARAYYDAWAERYDDEVGRNDYATPARAAQALAALVEDRTPLIADYGCGTGLAGTALAKAGFTCIDGFDIAPEMLKRAAARGVYRYLCEADLSQPLEIGDDTYAHAAAVGVLNPNIMPPTVLDEILRTVAPGGCFVFSVNDKHGGRFDGRVMELTDCGYADLLMREHGAHLPGIALDSTLYVLRRR